MCWILQKWFYICSGLQFVSANIRKILVVVIKILQKLLLWKSSVLISALRWELYSS